MGPTVYSPRCPGGPLQKPEPREQETIKTNRLGGFVLELAVKCQFNMKRC